MYVITGATGHTGSIAARTLLARGQKVRAIGRSAERLQSLASAGAEPFVADVTDAKRLTEAFRGAQAVYAMIPPNITSNDARGYQEQVSDAISSAIANAKVPMVVLLSSIGADKPDKTGPVVGLHNFEQKLNRIDGLNVLHVRAGYFMENTLAQANAIKAVGKGAGPLRPDLKVPMIATQDIGTAVAEFLLNSKFQGKQTQELLGQRDLNYTEATAIIGKAIGKPNLEYVQLPDEQVRPALIQFGMSQNVADLILEMAHALNSGHMRALEPRSPKNTTPTSFEQFVNENFVPIFKQQSTAA
jgi:uncharacterized protein YbjT (DUF2867 family)